MKTKRNQILKSNSGSFFVIRSTEDGTSGQTYGPFGTRRSAEGFVRKGEAIGFGMAQFLDGPAATFQPVASQAEPAKERS